MFEHPRTRRARGREDDGQQRVGGVREPHHARALVGELMPLGVAPQPLEAVEGPALAAEDVDDEVEVVEQDPFRLVDAFGQRRPLAELALAASRGPQSAIAVICRGLPPVQITK